MKMIMKNMKSLKKMTQLIPLNLRKISQLSQDMMVKHKIFQLIMFGLKEVELMLLLEQINLQLNLSLNLKKNSLLYQDMMDKLKISQLIMFGLKEVELMLLLEQINLQLNLYPKNQKLCHTIKIMGMNNVSLQRKDHQLLLIA
jgi:hypothetical protein